MKLFLTLICILALNAISQSQILKRIARDVKNEAEWKVRSKTNQKVDQALDSLLTKKEPEKKNTPAESSEQQNQKTTQQKQNKPTQQSAAVNASSRQSGEEMKMGDGYVTLFISVDEVWINGTVVIQGSSLKYGNMDKVKISITGPDTDEAKVASLYENNTFTDHFQPERSGDYLITAISPDGKAKETKKLKVLEMELTEWERPEQETDKALGKLKKEADRVGQSIGTKDKAELDKKIDEVEEKVALVKDMYKNLNGAMKQYGALVKKGLPLSPEINKNLSQLNDILTDQGNKMQQINESLDHEPYDNTVCEYLVMLNEACAAFSTFTNIWSKSIMTILKNIMLDKWLPKGVEAANNKAGAIPPDYDAQFKQPAKLIASAKFDVESLTSKMGAASFTGDIVQFASDMLMKKYCGVFKGELKHDYTITYRNKLGTPWWNYTYQTEAAITFRYPKTSGGKIIKMKGNIEGNATKFTFYQDIEQMEGFQEQMKGRAKLIPIQIHKPLAIPFASSQKDELGFGAVARGLATPAYFNIPVDAEYDTDAETIKLFLNDPLIDFGLMVKYVYGYVAIAAGIPLVTRVEFPVNKAKLTLNAVVSQNNELHVTKEGTSISGKGSRHIGNNTSEIEHQINYNLTAKKQ